MLTCHWMKCTLAFQVLEVEVTPMSHRKSSQGMVLKYEVSHTGLFLQTEVISYLDVQEVVIVDTIPEVCSASTNPIIDALRSPTNSNQDHRVLKFQRNGKSFSLLPFSFSFCLVEVEVQDPATCEVNFHSKRSRRTLQTTTGKEVDSCQMACSRSSFFDCCQPF